jgi:response regulator RpfG family c-di-GMP phosphodiesterase
MIKTTRSVSVPQSEQSLEQTLRALLHMLYLRECETEAESLRISEMTLKLAKKAGISEDEYEGIRIGALLHDIGKIAIPDKILFKQGKLTEAEWEIMQGHPQYAHDLLFPMAFFQHALDIPYYHHEHWDGTGYPRGLRGEETPLAARVFAIVDLWDALSSNRPFRAAWKAEAIRFYIAQQAGISLDPALVSLFLEIPGIFVINHKSIGNLRKTQ